MAHRAPAHPGPARRASAPHAGVPSAREAAPRLRWWDPFGTTYRTGVAAGSGMVAGVVLNSAAWPPWLVLLAVYAVWALLVLVPLTVSMLRADAQRVRAVVLAESAASAGGDAVRSRWRVRLRSGLTWGSNGMPLAIGACGYAVTAAFLALPDAGAPPGPARPVTVAIGVVALVVSWLLLHIAFAERYAAVFHLDGGIALAGRSASATGRGDAGRGDAGRGDAGRGDAASGAPEPDWVDFLALAFSVGMTTNTGDATITGRRARRLALGHALLSFAFNTVLLALALSFVLTS